MTEKLTLGFADHTKDVPESGEIRTRARRPTLAVRMAYWRNTDERSAGD